MLRGLVFDNLIWKVSSLALAVVLWYGLVGETEMASSINVPVLYKNLPRNLEISSDTPERIYLKLRGASARMSVSTLGEVAAVLDLSQVHKPGDFTFVLGPDTMDLPYGIELVRAVPSQVRLRFEKSSVRDVPVQARFSAPPSAGYRIAAQEIIPPTVRIAGPETRVQQTDFAETDPIDLTATYQAAEFRTTAGVDDPHIRVEGQHIVTVRIQIERIEHR